MTQEVDWFIYPSFFDTGIYLVDKAMIPFLISIGTYQTSKTFIGYTVPINPIPKGIEFYWQNISKVAIVKELSLEKLGRLGEELAFSALRAGSLRWYPCNIVWARSREEQLHRDGKAYPAKGAPFTFEVKADRKLGRIKNGGTGNIFLQIGECRGKYKSGEPS